MFATDSDNEVHFEAAPELLECLNQRAEPPVDRSEVAMRDLAQYYAVIRSELRAVAQQLSPNEACLIVDVLNGTLHLRRIPHNPQSVVWNVSDAIELSHLDAKWEVNGPTLVDKLKQLTPCQSLALTDAIVRFWITSEPTRDTVTGLHDVGIIHPERQPDCGDCAMRILGADHPSTANSSPTVIRW